MREKPIAGIYCWTNLINNKKYVGQSIHIKRRYYEYLNVGGSNDHFSRAIKNMDGKIFYFKFLLLFLNKKIICFYMKV